VQATITSARRSIFAARTAMNVAQSVNKAIHDLGSNEAKISALYALTKDRIWSAVNGTKEATKATYEVAGVMVPPFIY